MTAGSALGFFARPALLVAWSTLAWGHLVLVSTLVNAVAGGLGAAWERLLPAHQASLWAWLNAFSAALAFTFWAVVAGVVLWPRPRDVPPPPLDRISK